jgi:hypothetical protein
MKGFPLLPDSHDYEKTVRRPKAPLGYWEQRQTALSTGFRCTQERALRGFGESSGAASRRDGDLPR